MGVYKNKILLFLIVVSELRLFPTSGIRAREKFDLSGVWCLLHSTSDVDVIQNLPENISNENIAIILLNAFPESSNDVKSAIKYGRDNLTLSDVKNALKSKDLDLRKENKTNGENLFVRGTVDRREPSSHRSKSKGRSNLEIRIE
ncbi:hypothetical protein M9H77_18674 [Catharanthus roseus]|uniref:Uncharacterized protein n=1 Tax=Catharanthus roseus TaxID=4058 RepID=A0ACC0B835_CATRO|nr:hypothetical protein M9H77_18674 [Catharanthus roseus]